MATVRVRWRRAALLALLVLSCPAGASAAGDPVSISVLSSRADLVSGGDAMVRVDVPSGTDPATLTITVGQADVSSDFAVRSGGGFEGLVTGLENGPNVIKAVLPDGRGAQLTITNHPNGGPVFSGPQVQPWQCPPSALDAQCNQPPQFSYRYHSTDPTKDSLLPYDPANPPSDVADTTTDQGVSLPFVVRIETGYQDRDQYKIATLYRPDQPWSAFSPQNQWNHKLLITHGASCNLDYGSGGAPDVTADGSISGLTGIPALDNQYGHGPTIALGRGFAVMSTALDHNGHNCNLVTQAESLEMAKEHLAEAYGPIRYTIGTGCSGGSLTQQWVANAYPGIYQGILPTCSFPDTWTSAIQVMDYHLLRPYFEDPSKWGGGVAWSPTQMAAVEDNALPVNAVVSDIGFFSAIVPTHDCGGITAAERYDPVTHIDGVRCSIADYSINVFGPRPPSDWGANEQALGRGFAGVPVDNVGVEYGLKPLQQGLITPAQFVDLNKKIGGLDIDINPTAARIAATQPALPNAYRSGMINETNNLDRVAIIDARGPDPGAAHDSYRAFAIRARLDEQNGGHANQVIWEGPAPIVGDAVYSQQALLAMDRWLSAVEIDQSGASLESKIVTDKPADIHDQCSDGAGNKVLDQLCGDPIVPVYGTPRTAAGEDISTDTNKCRLKPLDHPGHGLLPFTDAEWSELQSLFPDGVCDFGQSGVDQTATVPWLAYEDASGDVVYGGRALGDPPASSPLPSGAVGAAGSSGAPGGTTVTVRARKKCSQKTGTGKRHKRSRCARKRRRG
jgi:hypothetical protein